MWERDPAGGKLCAAVKPYWATTDQPADPTILQPAGKAGATSTNSVLRVLAQDLEAYAGLVRQKPADTGLRAAFQKKVDQIAAECLRAGYYTT